MKKLLFFLVFSFSFSQTNCELCVEQNGFYCGNDESNWTQYSPNGCVPNGLNNLFYLNDGWLDCVDGSDESEAVPTTIAIILFNDRVNLLDSETSTAICLFVTRFIC